MSRPVLSFISTLKATFRLAAKQPRLMVMTGIAVSIPALLSDLVVDEETRQSPLAWSIVWSFASLVLMGVSVVTDALQRAAILGVLGHSDQSFSWPIIRETIRTRTWALVRVSILLALIAIPFIALLTFLFMSIGPSGISAISILSGFLFLVFLKYALADPIVVFENVGASKSLARSWQMTKGHFWYVVGCYLFLGGGLVAISYLPSLLELHGPIRALLTGLFELLNSVLSSLWMVLAWQMYSEIKAVENPASIPLPSSAPIPSIP